VDKILKKSY